MGIFLKNFRCYCGVGANLVPGGLSIIEGSMTHRFQVPLHSGAAKFGNRNLSFNNNYSAEPVI